MRRLLSREWWTQPMPPLGIALGYFLIGLTVGLTN